MMRLSFLTKTAPLNQSLSICKCMISATTTAMDSNSTFAPERITKGRRDVVTAFVQQSHTKYVLVVKRSGAVRTYQGLWGGVSGGVEKSDKSLVFRALEEISEEVGYSSEQVELINSGRPQYVDDKKWRFCVHPFLFKLKESAANIPPTLNWENVDAKFVAPQHLHTLETVPNLQQTLERVLLSPSQEEIINLFLNDRTHGAAELAQEALRALSEEAVVISDTLNNNAAKASTTMLLDSLLNFGYHIACCRPSMVPIANAVAVVLSEVKIQYKPHETDNGQLLKLLNEAIQQRQLQAQDKARLLQEQLIKLIPDGATIMTISLSSTIRSAVIHAKNHGKQLHAIVCESRPLCEGVSLANAWAECGVHVELITDAQAALFVPKADLVLIGADAFDVSGVVNKSGTRLLAMAANAADVPVYCVADSTKLSPGPGGLFAMSRPDSCETSSDILHEEKAANELALAWPQLPAASVQVRNIYFETTPLHLISGGIITEDGPLNAQAINDKVAALRRTYDDAFLSGA